jgi:uncharacterized protein
MIFDIEQIYDEGLDFDMLIPKEHFNLDSVDIVLTEDVRAQGKLEKSGHTILCHGSLQTKLSATCTRCLQVFSFTVNAELRVHFIPRVENNKPADEIELTSMDVEQEFYEGGQIDISSPSRDLILLGLTQVMLCREDCFGLCSECGTNLNENKCACKHEGSGDPRLAVLQQLKKKLK